MRGQAFRKAGAGLCPQRRGNGGGGSSAIRSRRQAEPPLAHFIDDRGAGDADEARDVAGERMALGPRLLYVSYGEGIGKTKLKLPAVKQGTARNMNSVAKMANLLAGME